MEGFLGRLSHGLLMSVSRSAAAQAWRFAHAALPALLPSACVWPCRACLSSSGLPVSGAVSLAGVELLQPSTALAGLALFALLYCALARLWSTRRSPLKQILDRHPLPHEEESRLQASPSRRASMLRSCLLGVTNAAASRAMALDSSAQCMATRRSSPVSGSLAGKSHVVDLTGCD